MTLFSTWLVLGATALGQNVSVRAPIDCISKAASCGSDISAAAAEKSYEGFRIHEHDCQTASGRQKYVCSLLPALDRHVCGEAYTTRHNYYYWAPPKAVKEGEKSLNLLRERATTGEVFGAGHIIVASVDSSEAETHLAMCDVTRLNGIKGPPSNCVTVAIVQPNKAWIRGRNPDQDFCYTSASFRSTGAIDIEYKLVAHLSPIKVSSLLLEMLRDDLKMSAEEQTGKTPYSDSGEITIRAAAPMRNSPILSSGWRESLDFDFDIYADDKGMRVHGVAHVLACRQAAGNLTEYRGLDDAQRSAYAKTLDSRVAGALRKGCSNAFQRDNETIECQ